MANDAGGAGNPTIFWLDGTAYHSLAAYQAAVAAKAAISQSTEEARKKAAALATVRLPVPDQTRAAQSAVSEDAANMALRRAEEVRRQQELTRIQAQQQQEIQRAQAARSLQIRQLMAAGKRTEATRLAQQQISQQREIQRKAAQARIAEQRRQAYDALQRAGANSRRLIEAHQRRDNAAIAEEQARQARELAQSNQWVSGGAGRGTTKGGTHNARISTDRATRDAQTKGETTGNWSDAIDILEQQSSSSGGRFVDDHLMQVVNERYVAPVVEVGNQYEQQMTQAKALFDANDMAGLKALIDSPEFNQLEQQFAEYFGDGRTPGSFAAHARVLTEIANRRERLWTAMMIDPNAPVASDADVQALIDRAVSESQFKSQHGGVQEGTDFSGTSNMLLVDHVMDPQTGGQKTVVKQGLDAWLAKAAAKERDRQEQAIHAYERQKQIDRYKTHGPERAAAEARFTKQLSGLLPDYQARLKAIQDASPGLRQELVRNMVRDAANAYDKANGAPESPGLLPVRGRITDPEAGKAQAAAAREKKAAFDAKTEFLSMLKRALPGADGSGYGFGDRIDQSYGFGDLVRWAQLPLSGMLAGMRRYRAEGRVGIGPLSSGQLYQPDFNRPSVDLRFGFEKGSGSPIRLDVGTIQDPNGKAAYDAYIKDMQSPDSNVRDNAQRAYGSGVIGGNLGWLIEGLADPLNALTPMAWLNRARLAVAVGGGLRELNSLGGIERALLAYAKYSAPEAIGGFGRSALRTDLAKMALGRETGMASTEVLRLSDDEIRALAEKATLNATELAADSTFKKLVARTGIDKDQLLNIVQDKLPGIAREFGLNAVDPFEMTARIRAAREGFARAEQVAKEAADLAARKAAREEGRLALEALRREAGVKIAERASLDAAKLARHEKLLAGYLGSSQEYLTAARRANRAADAIEEIGRMAVPDHNRLQTAHAQLQKALAESERYADTFTTNADTGLREVTKGSEGIVARRYRALAEYTDQFPGGDPAAPRFADLSWRQIQNDRVVLESRIKGLARAMRTAKNDADIGALKARMIEAQKAKAGLDFEQAVLDARGAVRREAHAARARIKPAVRPTRLGAKASSEVERRVESSRTLSAQISRQREDQIRSAPAVSAANEKAAQATHEALHAKTGQDVATALKHVIETRPGAKIANLPASEVLKQLEELAAKLKRPLSDIPLEDLAFALQRVASQDNLWGGAAAFVRRLSERVLRESGWTGGWKTYAEMFAGEHIRAGAVGSLAKLEELDAAIAARIKQVRGYKADDVVKAGAKRQAKAEVLSDMVRPDRDPAVVLAKMEVLSERGVTLFEYDELRGALREVMRNQRRQESMLAAAEKMAAAKGISVDEAFLAVREQWAERQSLRQFEEFALRPENAGRVPSQILRLFEERYIGRDLGQFAGSSYSTYQMDALRNAWKEVAGHDWENQVMRQRWLSGASTIDPTFARVVAPEELGRFGQDFKDALVVQVQDDKAFLDLIDQADNVVAARQVKALKRDAEGNLKGVFVWFSGAEEGVAARDLTAGIYVFGEIDQETLAHEVMHAMWQLPDNGALVDELTRYAGRLGTDDTLLKITNVEGVAGVLGDRQEAISELYALWYTKSPRWAEIYNSLDESGQLAMDMIDSRFRRMAGPIRAQMGFGPHAPPLGDRVRMRNWLVKNGYWAPRTGEDIASGQRVWSIAEERQFFEANWAYTPPWTDEAVLAPLLNDQRALKEAFAEWGFFDNGFEQVIGGTDLTPEELLGSVVWGGNGLNAKRSLAEMRQWAVERYGPMVGSIAEDGTVTLERMPWLMKADNEYLSWMEKALSEEGRAARIAEWEGARTGLPRTVERAAFADGKITEFGSQIDGRLVKPSEVDKLNAVLVKATKRRIERLQKAGDLAPGDWLPQERMAFAYDVTQELLIDPVWRGLLRGTPVAGQALHLWSSFWRFLVSFQPAFPIMNLIEAAGLRRLLLGVYENGFRPLSVERDKWLIEDLRSIGGGAESLFRLADHEGGTWMRVGDKMLPANIRGGAFVRSVLDVPMTVSKAGEEALRLDFVRAVAGNTYRAALKTGMEAEAAAWLARFEAKRMMGIYFSVGTGNSFLNALDQLVPFLRYNWNNKKLAMRMIAEHPAILEWGVRIAAAIKEGNRKMWEEEYPGVPFPEDNPSSSWLWFKVGEDFYSLDLSIFSDWTRSIKDVAASQNAVDWFTEFIRVPHPSQLGFWAMLTGGQTPWGKPGSPREMSIWIDFLEWSQGIDYEDPKNRRNGLQMLSQFLFFKKFGRITPITAKVQQYWAFKAMDEAKAREYLDANPDLGLYFGFSNGDGSNPKSDSWYGRMTNAARSEYDAAYAEFQALNNKLDAMIFEHVNEPWSDAYKLAKREAFIARTAFLEAHPILPNSWGLTMTPAEFAALKDKWVVDDLADAWFNWQRPGRSDFATDLEYQQGLVAYYEARTAFLEAHPALTARLYEGRNAIENAWHAQELQWSGILQFQAELKARILQEQANPDTNRELVSLLYQVRDAASLQLDAEHYTQAYGVVVPGGFSPTLSQKLISALAGPGKGLIKRVAEIPGFADFIYGNSTPEQRANIERNEWYGKSMAELVAKSTDGKTFYQELFKNPALLQEYWARNPDAKARYEAGREYFSWMSRWVAQLNANNFTGAQAVWDAMPAAVRERYLAAHPDSAMGNVQNQSYYAAMGKWIELLKAKDYVAADKFFRSMPAWMREKYYAKHPGQRAQHELDSATLRKGAEYFLATGDDKLAILQKYPELQAFLAKYGGDEAAYRGLIAAMYRAIPQGEAWLRRTFREHFPEIFSQESIGAKKLAEVARDLAKHPEMQPFYDKAFALQSHLWTEQLKLQRKAPRPLEMERKRRLLKRTKRRAARFHSLWSLHRDLRRYKG